MWYNFYQGTSVSITFYIFEHYQLWMMDSKAQSLITFLFYGWTEQPRPEKSRGGGVCFMINKKWCDPRNISILSRSCSPHLEHLSIICRPFYLPPRVLRGHRYCRLHSTSGRHELGFVQTPQGAKRLHQQTP